MGRGGGDPPGWSRGNTRGVGALTGGANSKRTKQSGDPAGSLLLVGGGGVERGTANASEQAMSNQAVSEHCDEVVVRS